MSGPICPFFLVCFAVGADRFEQSSVHWPGRQKKCMGLWKFVLFADPAQHRPNALFQSDMAATWALDLGAHLAPTSAQLGSNMAKLGPNLDPFREQLRHKLKSTWLQNGGMADSKRNPQNTQIGSFRLNLSQTPRRTSNPLAVHIVPPLPGFGWAKSARLRHPASLTKILHERCPSFVFHSAPASLPIPAISPHGSMSLQISCLSNSLDAGGTRRGVTRICIWSYLVLLVCFAKTAYLPPDQVAA